MKVKSIDVSELNLEDFQDQFLGEVHNLIIPEDNVDKERELKQASIRRIVSLYKDSRSVNGVLNKTINALKDNNKWTRLAAADIICKYGNENSFGPLFKALEDEENSKIKMKIAKLIDRLETRINNIEMDENVSLKDVSRILTYSR